MALCPRCQKTIDDAACGAASCPRCTPLPTLAGVPDSGDTLAPAAAPASGGGTAEALPFSAAFLARFHPVRRLGQGAMGAVYLMTQLDLGRSVAVKSVREDRLDPEMKERLIREAQVLARINHPHVVTVHAIGTDGDRPYMVCEYVPGQTLAEKLQAGPALAVAEVASIAGEILEGLDAIHRHGVVHRDLKPANIVLATGGRVKLVDFGLARAETVAGGTLTGRIMGTPPYMSPEQCVAEPATAASDLYSAGVILFEMLSGRPPFTGPSVHDYLAQHTGAPPPDLLAIRPDLPPALGAVVARALAKRPGERFLSAAEFRESLAAACAPGRAVTPPAAARGQSARALALATAVALAAALLAHGLRPPRPPRRLALLVGITTFRAGMFNAPGSAAAARAMQEALKSERSGAYETLTLLDEEATGAEIRAALAVAAELGPGDQLVFFFAGHLQPLRGEPRLIPHDMRAVRPGEPLDSLLVEAPSLGQVLAPIFESRAGVRTVILDAQCAGAAVELARRRWPGDAPPVAIFAAAGADGPAFAMGDLSLYTSVLLEGWNGLADAVPPAASGDGDGTVSASELARYVEKAVPERLARAGPDFRQQPVSWIGADVPLARLRYP